MDDIFPALDEIDKSELSEDDLAVLQAFEAMENWPAIPVKTDSSQYSDPALVVPLAHFTPVNDDGMFMIFISEAEEDIASMQQILKYLDQEDHINPARFVRLQRLGHKLRGTAGAVDFPIMSTIASHVEVIAEQVTEGKVYPLVGIYALSQTISALERHLHEIISQGKEPEGDVLLATLDVTYRNLNIDLQLADEKGPVHTNLVGNSKLRTAIIESYEDAEDIPHDS